MITIRANTLAAAIFRAAVFVNRGAEVKRCIRAGESAQWTVVLGWPTTAGAA